MVRPALAAFALMAACLAPLELLAAPRLPTDPAEVLERLPMRPGNRSLNLSNAVAVAVYEAWRQNGFAGANGREGDP